MQSSSVETINNRIREKFNLTRTGLTALQTTLETLTPLAKKTAADILSRVHLNLLMASLDTCESNYDMIVILPLSDYHGGADETKIKKFKRVIASENIIAIINDIAQRCIIAANVVLTALEIKIVAARIQKNYIAMVTAAANKLNEAKSIVVNIGIERRNWDMCKCGFRRSVIPELSEMHCTNPECGKVKLIIGTVFRDDQFYPQEGQKTKHGGYDTSRHYRFWIERLQAIEQKTFDDATIEKIDYIISRDKYSRKTLTCAQMRIILKDPMVDATILNDHAPRLVTQCGGRAPPQLSFQEDKIICMRFAQAMILYDIVNPKGKNKPYYPYFIYKLIEHYFCDNPEKLRLLDYIHLQSRETIMKNDNFYKKMAQLADPGDGIVYTPTDPCGRF